MRFLSRSRRLKKLVVYPGKDGRWYFHVVNRNGKITEPSQGYSRKSTALHAAQRDVTDYDVLEVNP